MYLIPRNTRSVVHPVLYLAYFFAGVATVQLGATLPFLSTRWPISDALAGSLFAAQFGGGVVGAIVATRFPRASFLAGFCIGAPAIASLGWAPWSLAPLIIFFLGIGLGSIVTSGNILAARLASAAGASAASALAMVHFAWGLGAVSCPWLFQAASAAYSGGLFFVLLGLAFGLMALGIFLCGRNAQVSSSAASIIRNTLLSVKTRYFYAFALLLYTGAENAISGWLPSYVTRTQAALPPPHLTLRSQGSLAYSFLWVGILTGRFALRFALRLRPERALYRGAILSLLVSVVFLVVIPEPRESASILCTISAACGLSLAGIYPLLVARLLNQSVGTRGLGWVSSFAGVGGASLPWLTGLASTRFGSLRAAISVPALAVALLLLLVPRIYPRESRGVPWHPGRPTHHELG